MLIFQENIAGQVGNYRTITRITEKHSYQLNSEKANAILM